MKLLAPALLFMSELASGARKRRPENPEQAKTFLLADIGHPPKCPNYQNDYLQVDFLLDANQLFEKQLPSWQLAFPQVLHELNREYKADVGAASYGDKSLAGLGMTDDYCFTRYGGFNDPHKTMIDKFRDLKIPRAISPTPLKRDLLGAIMYSIGTSKDGADWSRVPVATQKIILIVTASLYHKMGDFPGHPPNRGDSSAVCLTEDYPAIDTVGHRLRASGVVPIILTTPNHVAAYEDLIQQMGTGGLVIGKDLPKVSWLPETLTRAVRFFLCENEDSEPTPPAQKVALPGGSFFKPPPFTFGPSILQHAKLGNLPQTASVPAPVPLLASGGGASAPARTVEVAALPQAQRASSSHYVPAVPRKELPPPLESKKSKLNLFGKEKKETLSPIPKMPELSPEAASRLASQEIGPPLFTIRRTKPIILEPLPPVLYPEVKPRPKPETAPAPVVPETPAQPPMVAAPAPAEPFALVKEPLVGAPPLERPKPIPEVARAPVKPVTPPRRPNILAPAPRKPSEPFIQPPFRPAGPGNIPKLRYKELVLPPEPPPAPKPVRSLKPKAKKDVIPQPRKRPSAPAVPEVLPFPVKAEAPLRPAKPESPAPKPLVSEPMPAGGPPPLGPKPEAPPLPPKKEPAVPISPHEPESTLKESVVEEELEMPPPRPPPKAPPLPPDLVFSPPILPLRKKRQTTPAKTDSKELPVPAGAEPPPRPPKPEAPPRPPKTKPLFQAGASSGEPPPLPPKPAAPPLLPRAVPPAPPLPAEPEVEPPSIKAVVADSSEKVYETLPEVLPELPSIDTERSIPDDKLLKEAEGVPLSAEAEAALPLAKEEEEGTVAKADKTKGLTKAQKIAIGLGVTGGALASLGAAYAVWKSQHPGVSLPDIPKPPPPIPAPPSGVEPEIPEIPLPPPEIPDLPLPGPAPLPPPVFPPEGSPELPPEGVGQTQLMPGNQGVPRSTIILGVAGGTVVLVAALVYTGYLQTDKGTAKEFVGSYYEGEKEKDVEENVLMYDDEDS